MFVFNVWENFITKVVPGKHENLVSPVTWLHSQTFLLPWSQNYLHTNEK